MGIERSVVEHEPHLGRIGFDLLELAALQIAPQLLQLPGRLREVGVDGIELLNGGKVGRLALPNQRAFGHQCATDTAADRRADAGIVEIELGARPPPCARRHRLAPDETPRPRPRTGPAMQPARRPASRPAWLAARPDRAPPAPWRARPRPL